MPLLHHERNRSPISTWWQASWMVGVALWVLLLQLFIAGSATMFNSGIVRLLLVVGVLLSTAEGVPYVRGDVEPPRRRRHEGDGVQVLSEEGRPGVVVMNQAPAGPTRKEKTHPAHVVFYAAPRTLGDAVLTLLWKLVGRVLGREERRMLNASRADTPTGEFHMGAPRRKGTTAVVERHEPRYRIFRP